MQETKRTLTQLLALGVETEKIRLVLNKSENTNLTTQWIEFDEVIEVAKSLGISVPLTAIQHNEIFTHLRKYHLSLQQLLELKTDIKSDNKGFGDKPNLYYLHEMAQQAKTNLDDVFNDLNLVAEVA